MELNSHVPGPAPCNPSFGVLGPALSQLALVVLATPKVRRVSTPPGVLERWGFDSCEAFLRKASRAHLQCQIALIVNIPGSGKIPVA